MNVQLNAQEARIIGCLMEKAVTTPEQCPLTLNALTNACNQKSSRNPVMNLPQGEVQRTARQLADKYLIRTEEGKSGVEKYTQRLCNTPMAGFQFTSAEYAVVCLLLLRGAQTPGELRSRSGRLHSFAGNQEVADVLEALMAHEKGPIVARLPKTRGRLDHEYMHLFSGEIESVPRESVHVERAAPRARDERIERVEARIDALERALIALAGRLGEEVVLAPGEPEPDP